MALKDEFNLRYDEFSNKISSTWQNLQYEKDLCDVTLACEDRQILSHKIVISSCSPVFKNILKHNASPHPVIYLRGVKYKDIECLLNFLYSGEVNIPQKDLSRFLLVAE